MAATSVGSTDDRPMVLATPFMKPSNLYAFSDISLSGAPYISKRYRQPAQETSS